MLSIDQEIGIESKDRVPVMDFSHANDTGIRERHWSIAIFIHQPT